ncbi:MAG: hypothetical protein IK093_12580 [Ruminiclostridium sp.]|nr:hypothetical protein [Ruminiclostridium sp.]
MKLRYFFFTTALAAAIALSGCEKQDETPPRVENHTLPYSGDAAESTGAPETTQVPETTAGTTLPKVTRTVIYTGICDHNYYLEDSTVNAEGLREFKSSVMRLSSGIYADTRKQPELFDTDALAYTGERAPLGTVVQIKAGDRVGDYRVKEASTALLPPRSEETGEYDTDATDMYSPYETHIVIDGEITLKGAVIYYASEHYDVLAGDILFIPDSSYKGLPVPTDISGDTQDFGSVFLPCDTDENMFPHYNGGLCLYSDAPVIRLGNLYSDYDGDIDLHEFFGDKDTVKRVSLSLSDLRLAWSSEDDLSQCSARITMN